MAGWINFLVTKIATHASLPALGQSSLFFTQDRKRLVYHDGAAWQECATRLDRPLGEVFDMAYKKTISETFPALRVDDSDHDISTANYPLLVPDMRAVKAEAWGGAAYFDTFSGTVAGSVFTGPVAGAGAGDAFTYLLAALLEEEMYHGSYNTWRCINIAGTDFVITNVNPGARTVAVSGSPTSGAQSASVYQFRIAGSTTTARVFKMAGQATMAQDGVTYIAGFRRRDRMQGHKHVGANVTGINASVSSGGNYLMSSSGGTAHATDSNLTPTTDGVNNTPRTGLTTDPNMTAVYRYMWAGAYAP